MRFILLVFVSISFKLFAQDSTTPNRINLVLGVGQLAQNGFNIEGNLFFRRLTFDYSHGISLDIGNDQLEEGNDQAQGLDIHLPWTTGFGVGYQFTDWLNLRVEPKWHKFELYGQDDEQIAENFIGDYTTFTLGLGLYANWLPFKKKDNFLKGIMIVPHFKWWPRISSNLENDELTYFSSFTAQQETHEARQIGINNTPMIYNVSIGYSVKL